VETRVIVAGGPSGGALGAGIAGEATGTGVLDGDGRGVAVIGGSDVVAEALRVAVEVRVGERGVVTLVAVALLEGVTLDVGDGVDAGNGVEVRVAVWVGIEVLDGVGEGLLVGVGRPATRDTAAPQSRRPAPCPACPRSFAVACMVASTVVALAPAPRISAAQAETCGVAIDVPVPPP